MSLQRRDGGLWSTGTQRRKEYSLSLEKKGEPELAIRALQRAAAMDPNNAITHHLLGQAYRDLGKNEDAERELKLAGQLQSGESR